MCVMLSLANARAMWRSAGCVQEELHQATSNGVLVSDPRRFVMEKSQNALPSSENKRLDRYDNRVVFDSGKNRI